MEQGALDNGLRHVATFCGSRNCGCPSLYLDEHAEPDRQVVFMDDFGQRIQMSRGQWRDVVAAARSGQLDDVLG